MGNSQRIVVIGGGIGGYPAALRAARGGAEVTLVEKDLLGGTCLNRGCIPTKSLLHAGEVLHTIRHAEVFGVTCGRIAVDFKAVANRKAAVVNQLRAGVEGLLKKKRIKVVKGSASLIDPGAVRIAETGETLAADKILIATGSAPRRIPLDAAPGVEILDSDRALQLDALPKSLVIIGGGVIGVEFAQIFNRFGVEVTVLEMLDQLAPGMDAEISAVLETCLVRDGVQVTTRAGVKQLTRKGNRTTVHYDVDGRAGQAAAEAVLLAVGRAPFLEGLGIDRLGLETAAGALVVNDRMETNIPGVYAAGDVTGKTMLAHAAAAQSECAVDNMLGRARSIGAHPVAGCIYTAPEVGCVGLTEAAARERHDVVVGRFPLAACGKAKVIDQTEGMVKIVADKRFGEILGVHIIGPRATDLIAEAVLGMRMEMTVEDLARAVHPHPTVSESLMEAAMAMSGGAVHIP